MSVEVSNMPQYPPLPRFATSSSYEQQQQQQLTPDGMPNGSSTPATAALENVNYSAPATGVSSSACDTDFDLLAEYLLDDNTLNSSVVGFSSGGYYDVSSELSTYSNTSTQPVEDQSQVQAAPNPMINSSFSDPLADANAIYQQATTQDPLAQVLPLPPQPTMTTGAPQVQAQQQPVYVQQAAPVPQPTRNATTIVHHHHQQTVQQQQPQTVMLSGYKRPTPTDTNQQRPNQRYKSQAQLDKRRERNRILARQTRLRKKYFFESLQKEVMDLQYENLALKEIVKQNFPSEQIKNQILEECKLTENIISQNNQQINKDDTSNENKNLEDIDYHFICSVKKSQQCFVITDPSLYDNPIVYASDDFYSLTGYSRDEVLGRNCRFLQGKDTSKEKLHKIKQCIGRGEDVGVCMINYTAQGIAFWNQLFIAALRDTQGNVVNFIGVLVNVKSPPTDDPEYGKPLVNDIQVDEEQHGNQSQQQHGSNNVDELLGAASAAVSAAEAATTTDNVLIPNTPIPLITSTTSPMNPTTSPPPNVNNTNNAPATTIA